MSIEFLHSYGHKVAQTPMEPIKAPFLFTFHIPQVSYSFSLITLTFPLLCLIYLILWTCDWSVSSLPKVPGALESPGESGPHQGAHPTIIYARARLASQLRDQLRDPPNKQVKPCHAQTSEDELAGLWTVQHCGSSWWRKPGGKI